jgi:hypothetical protein
VLFPKTRIIIFIGVMLLSAASIILPEQKSVHVEPVVAAGKGSPSDIYREIRKRFAAYNRGLFGSRPYYRRELYDYLAGNIGNEILTDYDYLLVFPDIERGEFHCRLNSGSWLVIRGSVDLDSLKKATGGSDRALSTWWRSNRLVAVRGAIRRFRISDGEPRALTLVLKKIYIKEMND